MEATGVVTWEMPETPDTLELDVSCWLLACSLCWTGAALLEQCCGQAPTIRRRLGGLGEGGGRGSWWSGPRCLGSPGERAKNSAENTVCMYDKTSTGAWAGKKWLQAV